MKFPEVDLPPAPHPRQVKLAPHLKQRRYLAVCLRMERWLVKKRRADRALAKLRRQRKYYERDAAIRRL